MSAPSLFKSLREAWLNWRNGLIASPEFQRWAAGFWPTQAIARKSAQDVFDVVAGFVYSQTLVAIVELEILEILRDGPRTTQVLAGKTGLSLDATVRILRAGQSLGILDEAGEGRYALGMKGAAILGNGGLREMIKHHALLYQDLADPVSLLKSGGGQGALAQFWPYAAYDQPDQAAPTAVSSYSALMAATQPMVAQDILHAYPMTAHRRLLDIGGGEGAFAIAAAKTYPQLSVGVFDLPAVAARATARFKAVGLSGRASAMGGDFRTGIPHSDADVISLVRILHDHDEPTAMSLLQSIRSRMKAGDVLLIAEPMSDAPKPDPMAEAYFGLYLLAMGRGHARRPQEIAQMLQASGFSQVKVHQTRTPMLVRVLTAKI